MQSIVSMNNVQVIQSRETLLNIPKLDLYKGCQIAIVGGNGAGKTTLLETVLGLRKTNNGQILLNVAKRELGVQLQNATYNKEMLVNEVMALHRCVYGTHSDEICELFNLKELMSKRYGRLSRGQKQRVDLYVAMAHHPTTLVLDEPGTGLDTHYNGVFMQLLNRFSQQADHTLCMASHSARELEQASHILWIEKGQVIEFSPKERVFSQYLGTVKVQLDISEGIEDEAKLVAQLRHISQVLRVEYHTRERIDIYGSDAMRSPILSLIEQLGLQNYSFAKVTDDDFLNLVSGKHSNAVKGAQ